MFFRITSTSLCFFLLLPFYCKPSRSCFSSAVQTHPLLPQIHIQVQATPALSKKWMELQHILKLYLLILLHHTGLAYFLVTLMDQSFALLKATVLNHFPT